MPTNRELETSLPPLKIEQVGKFNVVRDDLIPGGTKRRVLLKVLPDIEAQDIFYAAHPYGHGAIALAHACKAMNKNLHLYFPDFVGDSFVVNKISNEAVFPDIEIHFCKVREQMELFQHVRSCVSSHPGGYVVPVGFNTAEFLDALVDLAKSIRFEPEEVWVLAGSGTLARALSRAWPNAQFRVVLLGLPHVCLDGIRNFSVFKAPEQLNQRANAKPPYPSAEFYDAKVWQFMNQHGADSALMWNAA